MESRTSTSLRTSSELARFTTRFGVSFIFPDECRSLPGPPVCRGGTEGRDLSGVGDEYVETTVPRVTETTSGRPGTDRSRLTICTKEFGSTLERHIKGG